MTSSDVTRHVGSCHCGALAFAVETDLAQVIECNCSHCYRKGLMLTFVQPDAFTVTAGEGVMRDYLFNTHNIRHHICPTCGVEPFGRGKGPDGKEMVAINIRCLTDVEPFSIAPNVRFDGLHRL